LTKKQRREKFLKLKIRR